MSVASEDRTPVHEEMFKTLLRTPHRRADEVLAIHREQFERDPNFYGHLACYAVTEGHCVIRDVNEVFIAILLASPYKAHQEAGYVMFQGLPPFEAARVARYYTGYDEMITYHSYESKFKDGFGVTYELACYSKKHPDSDKRGKVKPQRTIKLGRQSKLRQQLLKDKKISSSTTEIHVSAYVAHHACLGQRTFKGALRAAAKSYLKRRELNERMMEGAVLRSRKHIKQFYVRTNTLPQSDVNGWVNQYLWFDKVQEGSRLAALKSLQGEKDPTKQAEIIVKNKLPRTLVSSVVSEVTPSIMTATAMVMSSQELMQSLGWFKKNGAFDNPELKKFINDKLKEAKSAKRVDALKGAQVSKVVEGLDEETQKILKDVSDTQLKRHGNISRRTLLGIDKSGSMTDAIELGKQLAASIAQACKEDNPPQTFLFDNIATRIEWDESDGDITSKSAWDDKLEMVSAGGGTTPSDIIRVMDLRKLDVEQIVLVTDEGELSLHYGHSSSSRLPDNCFAAELKKFNEKHGRDINVLIVRIGRNKSNIMEESLKKAGVSVDVLPCDDIDSIAIPNLLQLLAKPSIFELVQSILEIKLPKRSAWDAKYLTKAVA